jgi:Ca2+-binding RTX toxin-like protein
MPPFEQVLDVKHTIKPLNSKPVKGSVGVDINGDGIIDVVYLDSDGDGMPDKPVINSKPIKGSVGVDINGDGIIDVVYLDSDGDGKPDKPVIINHGDETGGEEEPPQDKGQIFYGTEKQDEITGGNGDDTIFASSGNDIIDGGSGSDTIDLSEIYIDSVTKPVSANQALNNGAVYINLTPGHGVIGIIADSTGFNWDVNNNNGIIITDDTSLTNIENVNGSNYNDIIMGTAGDNLINGMDGDDFISGQGGNDVIQGGSGNDYITNVGLYSYIEASGELHGDDGDDFIVGYGAQVVDGGNGNDYLIGNNIIEGVIYGGDGNDTIYAMNFDESAEYGHVTINGGDGNDSVHTDNTDNTTYLGNGNDNFMGYDGDHIVYGGEGNDTLQDLSGNNEFWGGEGADNFFFGVGGYVTMDYVCYTDYHDAYSTTVIKDFELGVDRLQIGVYSMNNDTSYTIDDYAGGAHINIYNSSVNYNLDIFVENVTADQLLNTNLAFLIC